MAEFALLGRQGQGAGIAEKHGSFAHRFRRGVERLGNAFLEQALFQPDAQITGQDARDVGRFQRAAPGKDGFEHSLTLERSAGFAQLDKNILQSRRIERSVARPAGHDFARGQSGVIATARNGAHFILAHASHDPKRSTQNRPACLC